MCVCIVSLQITCFSLLCNFCFLNFSLDPLPQLGSWGFGVRDGKYPDGDLQSSFVRAIC